MSFYPQKSQKFKIIIRLRPQIKQDLKTYKKNQIANSLEASDSTITLQRKNNQEKTFKFNSVLNPGQQQEIYKESQNLVNSLFEGFNSTFLAYGQTGTGKTHTVFGSQIIGQEGYFFNAVKDIFAKIKQKMHIRQFAVRVSFIQFYLDNIYDLIANDNKVQIISKTNLGTKHKQIQRLELKQNADSGIYIKDLTQIPVKSQEQLFTCVKQAVRLRKTQQTSINKRSSRSHAVIQITLLQRWIENGQTKYTKGFLKIVDLAGSQRVSKTQSNGNRLQQAKRINKEITTLGKCINMLAISQKQGKLINNYDIVNKFNFNKSYIPFRDSKITRFLSDSLDGKSKIILCVCVSKYLIHIQQTFSSLLFASQASTLKIDSKRNEVMTLTPQKGKFQTPTKLNKTDLKRSITPMRSSTQTSQNSIRLDYVTNRQQNRQIQNQNHVSIIALKQKQKICQSLLSKFRSQIDDIDYYLKTKQIRNSQSIAPQKMKQNLCQMNKIFNLYRKKSSFLVGN